MGCGKPGEDGAVFLSINDSNYADELALSYWDDNPAIPVGASWGTYYISDPGSYNYEYDVAFFNSYSKQWFESTVTGSYKLTANQGDEGTMFKNGADGADKYYDLYCNTVDPYIEHWNKSATIEEPIALPDTIIISENYTLTITRTIMPSDYISPNQPKLITDNHFD